MGDSGDVTEIDLGVDARIRPAETGPLGPMLALEELAADKMLALFGRAQARDFIDVAALVARLGFDRVCELAAEKVPSPTAALATARGGLPSATGEGGERLADLAGLDPSRRRREVDPSRGRALAGVDHEVEAFGVDGLDMGGLGVGVAARTAGDARTRSAWNSFMRSRKWVGGAGPTERSSAANGEPLAGDQVHRAEVMAVGLIAGVPRPPGWISQWR